jgi:hypothetical protein
VAVGAVLSTDLVVAVADLITAFSDGVFGVFVGIKITSKCDKIGITQKVFSFFDAQFSDDF